MAAAQLGMSSRWMVDKRFPFTKTTKQKVRIDALYRESRIANGLYSWQYDYKIDETKTAFVVKYRVKPDIAKNNRANMRRPVSPGASRGISYEEYKAAQRKKR